MKITEHVHAIKIPFHVTNDHGMILERFVYAYLILGKELCLVDSGVAASENVIYNYMENIGINPDNISLMILTHSHPDHIGSAPSIKTRTGCCVAAHSDEKTWIEDVELQFNERPVPNFHSLVEGSLQIDKLLKNGDKIDLGENLTLEVIHTPGHSKGSISLYLPSDGVLFTGDSIPLQGDLPIYEDVKDSVHSIKQLKTIKGVRNLLASWDEPIHGDDVYKIMDDGLKYLQCIHEAVVEVAVTEDKTIHDDMDFTRLVLKKLGLPEMVANPIIAQSFESNLSLGANKGLFSDKNEF